jgi:4-diphosphocytidyl-2-C-methyl-D-erythritol kinase
MTVLATEAAPAKINLCLFLGPARADRRHELVTVFDSIALTDELEVVAGGEDTVVCDGVEGPNLVTDALAALRAAGWDAPPVTVRIRKRIPVAAGMGGGSADAAAMLRLAPRLARVAADVVAGIATRLGADVPAQLDPGPSLGTGAGDVIDALPALAPYGVLVLPQPFALSTAHVFREADRLGLSRPADDLSALRAELTAVLPAAVPPRLVVNDLEAAALSLRPEIAGALDAARDAGADAALVCGSGPTSIGIFWGRDGLHRARVAAAGLARAHPGAVAVPPVHRGVRPSTPNE